MKHIHASKLMKHGRDLNLLKVIKQKFSMFAHEVINNERN